MRADYSPVDAEKRFNEKGLLIEQAYIILKHDKDGKRKDEAIELMLSKAIGDQGVGEKDSKVKELPDI